MIVALWLLSRVHQRPEGLRMSQVRPMPTSSSRRPSSESEDAPGLAGLSDLCAGGDHPFGYERYRDSSSNSANSPGLSPDFVSRRDACRDRRMDLQPPRRRHFDAHRRHPSDAGFGRCRVRARFARSLGVSPRRGLLQLRTNRRSECAIRSGGSDFQRSHHRGSCTRSRPWVFPPGESKRKVLGLRGFERRR
jgi:hypothetical protein